MKLGVGNGHVGHVGIALVQNYVLDNTVIKLGKKIYGFSEIKHNIVCTAINQEDQHHDHDHLQLQ